MKNLISVALAAFVMTATANFAVAQEEDPFDPAGDESGTADPYTPESSTSAPEPATVSDANDGLKMAFSVPLFRGFDLGSLAGLAGVETPVQTARFLYALDSETWLNLSVGLSFDSGPTIDDGMGGTIEGDGVFGLAVGVGYRMYKPTKGKIRPYLEPGVTLEAADVGSISDILGLSLGALMGVDYALWEQFTIGTSVGARLNTVNTFDRFTLNVFTADINATFWW